MPTLHTGGAGASDDGGQPIHEIEREVIADTRLDARGRKISGVDSEELDEIGHNRRFSRALSEIQSNRQLSLINAKPSRSTRKEYPS